MSLMVIQRDREREREIVDNREGTMLKNKYFSKILVRIILKVFEVN